MAKQPSGRRKLISLFDRAECPVYLLDNERQVAYCNTACLQWLNAHEADVLGQPCHYHSDSRLDSRPTAGLCPPPSAFESRRSTGIVWAARSLTELVRRRAHFLRLTDVDTSDFLLAQLGDHDEGIGSVSETEGAFSCERLHEALLDVRAISIPALDDCLLGNDPIVQQVRRQAKLTVECCESFVVCGASVDRRTQVAQAILEQRRKLKNLDWVPIDCGVLEGELLQTAVEVAIRRTTRPVALFLQNVDQLTTDAQQLVWRLLSDVGDRIVPVATAEGDLLAEVETGFDRHMALRLSPISIRLPEISEHLADLPLLVQAILERRNVEGRHQQIEFVSEEAMERLVCHSWTSYEQLEQLIKQACLTCQGNVMTLSDLPAIVQLTADAEQHSRNVPEKIQLDDYLREIERELIGRAMRQAEGNRAEASRLLGVSRSRLLRRLDGFEAERCEGERDGTEHA